MATRDPAAVARLLHVLVGRSGGAAGGRASPVMAVTGESASAKRQRTNLWGLPLDEPLPERLEVKFNIELFSKID